MTNILHRWYNCLLYIYKYFCSTWPVSLVYPCKPLVPSRETSTNVIRIIQQFFQHDQCGFDSEEICEQIQQLDFTEDILSVKDELYGLNLLQHAVVLNCKEVVFLLLQRVYLPPATGCNSPTHMAASLGHVYILQCLLEKRPKDIQKIAGLCYPELHEPVSHRRRFGLVFQPMFRCEEEKMLPLEFAITSDRDDCVKVIVNTMNDLGQSQKIHNYLHFAASHGAEKCLQYFVTKYPATVNQSNSDGDVPLLQAVVWGRQCAKLLIANGADVTKVAENGDTALHRLYRNDIDGIFAIFDTTRYLLTTGIEQLINSINLKGETALHLLVTHVSYIGGNYYHPEERQLPRWQLQPNYQEQVIQTIQLLLDFNADPTIYDSLHLQPLNKLLHVTMKASSPSNLCECIQGSINSKYVYRNDFGSLGRAIDVLIQCGADVNTQCDIGHTPLILLLQTLLNTEIADLVQQSKEVLVALEILFKSGAKCNFLSDDHGTCATLLAKMAKRVFVNLSPMFDRDTDRDMRIEYSELINSILLLFLKHGLNPNHVTSKKSRHLLGGQGNALIEFVRLTVCAVSSDEFAMIHKWLCTLLQWGADPDIEPYPSDPMICHSQSSIFLKKQGTQAVSHYIHEVKELEAIFETECAESLLLLFYKTMDHKILFECLTTACFMALFHPLGATGQNFLAILNSMTDHPRSLKQMSRVCIYRAINRKISTAVDQLPLPRSLKQYLYDIE